MKKFRSLILCAALLTAMLCVNIFGLSPGLPSVTVTVIDENGEILLSRETIGSDSTILNLLSSLHLKAYPEGKEGFAFEETENGVIVTKIWGKENCNFYVFNEGELITDLQTDATDFSHIYIILGENSPEYFYAYFKPVNYTAKSGVNKIIKLYIKEYDKNGNLTEKALADANITINGEATEIFTDEYGYAELNIAKTGRYVIGATHDSLNIISPRAVLEVTPNYAHIVMSIIFGVIALAAVCIAIFTIIEVKKGN